MTARKSVSRSGWTPPPLAVVAVILAIVLAMLYPEPLFQGRVFLSGDSANSDAFGAVGDASLADGHYPLWNPYLFCGMPTFGSLAYVKFLYPPSTLFNFLQQQLHFPPLTWLLAHLFFGGLGMAVLLRRWKLPLGAVVLGAVTWIILPKVVAWGVHGHGSKLGAAMYLPWIVAWTTDVLSGRGARAMALLALLLGLQFLRGHPQITYYTLLALGWLAVSNGLWQWTPGKAVATAVRWKRAGLLAAALVLAAAMGAALLVPVHAYQGHSVRGASEEAGGGGLDYATDWSLAPTELPTLVLPSAAGFGQATYLGAMPFNDYPNYFGYLLLLLGVCSWGTGRRRLVIALGVLCLLSLLVSFGKHFQSFYGLLYDVLPFFDRLRIPSMILILPGFALAILAAQGAARLSTSDWIDGRLRFVPWVAMGGGALLLFSGGSGLAQGPFDNALRGLAESAGKNAVPVLVESAWSLYRADLVRIGLVLLTAGAALLLAVRKPGFRATGLVWVLTLLVVLDLWRSTG